MELPSSVIWRDLAGGPNRSALVLFPSSRIRSVWIFFHGAGGSGAWTLEESSLGPTANRAGALLVLPEGRKKNPFSPGGFLTNPQVWDDGSGRFDDFLSPGDDLEYVRSLILNISAVAPECPIHFFGFSNGAAFAHRAIQAFSDKACSLAMVCGIPFSEINKSGIAGMKSPPPVLTIHGGKDPLIPWEGGMAQSPWTRKKENRPPVEPILNHWALSHGANQVHDLESHDGLIRKFRPLGSGLAWMENYLVSEMGHHWPGGMGRINWRIAGPPSWRLDGNLLLTEFFQRAESPKKDLLKWKELTHPGRLNPIPKSHPVLNAN